MENLEYKYRLREFVAKMPSGFAKTFKKELINEMGGKQVMVDRDFSILKSEMGRQIPIERLIIYAKKFHCTIEELLNVGLIKK